MPDPRAPRCARREGKETTAPVLSWRCRSSVLWQLWPVGARCNRLNRRTGYPGTGCAKTDPERSRWRGSGGVRPHRRHRASRAVGVAGETARGCARQWRHFLRTNQLPSAPRTRSGLLGRPKAARRIALFESMSEVIVAQASGLRTDSLGHHSGRPAIRKDSARLAASAGFLNGCFAIKCPIEKSGFIARHSAARTLAWSMSASRAWQPAINAATRYTRPGRMVERRQGLLIPLQDHVSLTNRSPVPGLIEVWIDLLGTLEPCQRLFSLADVKQNASHVGRIPLVVRIHLDRSPHVLQRQIIGPPHQFNPTQAEQSRCSRFDPIRLPALPRQTPSADAASELLGSSCHFPCNIDASKAWGGP